MTQADAKRDARQAAMARRATAHAGAAGDATGVLERALLPLRGRPLAGYLPIRTEIDPRPAMARAAAHGPVAVPVIHAPDAPLRFALWSPDTALQPGPFGAQIPADPTFVTPAVLIVPLLAFTARGHRLGYGGGFYDRTLQALRAQATVHAIGFAYAAQEVETLPLDPTDQPLDAIATESDLIAIPPGPDPRAATPHL